MTTLTGGASGLTGIPVWSGCRWRLFPPCLPLRWQRFSRPANTARQCIALKGDELAAKAMGINVTRVKMIAFLLSVALTSYSGVLYAFYMSYVDPTGFGWKKERRLGHYGILWRRQQPDRFHAGRLYPERPAAGTARLQNYRYVIYAVLVLLILNFKPSVCWASGSLRPATFNKPFAKLGKKNTAKKEG